MVIALKILSSSLMVILITEIANRNSVWGGLVAMMPVNIILSLIWLYVEHKDIALLKTFTSSALVGVFPTIMFLVTLIYLFGKNGKFTPSLIISLCCLVVIVILQQKLLGQG